MVYMFIVCVGNAAMAGCNISGMWNVELPLSTRCQVVFNQALHKKTEKTIKARCHREYSEGVFVILRRKSVKCPYAL
jgi:hypothetical protein